MYPPPNRPTHHRRIPCGFCFWNTAYAAISGREKRAAFHKLPISVKSILHIQVKHFFGMLNDQPCYAVELRDDDTAGEPFSAVELRQVFRRFETDTVQASGLAGHLLAWHRNHQYCSRCGAKNDDKVDERAKICTECGLVNYPRLSPAIIVAVIREGKILLAHSPRFPRIFTVFWPDLWNRVKPSKIASEGKSLKRWGFPLRTSDTSEASPGRFPIPSCWGSRRNTQEVKSRKTGSKSPTPIGSRRIDYHGFRPGSVFHGN